MNQKINNHYICLDCSYFSGWGGGRDFFTSILTALSKFSKEDKSFSLLVTCLENISQLDYLENKAKEIVKFVLRRQIKNRNEEFFYTLQKSYPQIQFLNHREFESFTEDSRNITLFTGRSFPFKPAKIKNFSYIPDLQHKHLPKNFNTLERIYRDLIFKSKLSRFKSVIVNSGEAKNDLMKFYRESRDSEIFILPYEIPLQRNSFDSGYLKESLKDREYFLVSNQFWKHKNHLLALRAFKLAKEEGHLKDVKLVFTGDIQDYRGQQHIEEFLHLRNEPSIKNDIYLTGYISKQDQLSLLYRARAVIQPTLFEGGPGGGIGFEARAYGIPLLLSDIPVNREMLYDNAQFFSSHDDKELADILAYTQFSYNNNLDDLVRVNEDRQKKLGSFIKDIAVGKPRT